MRRAAAAVNEAPATDTLRIANSSSCADDGKAMCDTQSKHPGLAFLSSLRSPPQHREKLKISSPLSLCDRASCGKMRCKTG